MSSPSSAIQIAGQLTSDDWAVAKTSLVIGGDGAAWQNAFDKFLKQRLELRYLGPIRTLQDNDTYSGEGFTICAIQCTLIEFLAAAHAGMNYRHKGAVPPYEYSQSGSLFEAFLTNQAPFSTHFTAQSAKDFYSKVRCGLLHEAATKDGWRIWAKSPNGRAIDAVQKRVYRDDLQKAIERFVDDFRLGIATDQALQGAFLRKFDDLSRP